MRADHLGARVDGRDLKLDADAAVVVVVRRRVVRSQNAPPAAVHVALAEPPPAVARHDVDHLEARGVDVEHAGQVADERVLLDDGAVARVVARPVARRHLVGVGGVDRVGVDHVVLEEGGEARGEAKVDAHYVELADPHGLEVAGETAAPNVAVADGEAQHLRAGVEVVSTWRGVQVELVDARGRLDLAAVVVEGDVNRLEEAELDHDHELVVVERLVDAEAEQRKLEELLVEARHVARELDVVVAAVRQRRDERLRVAGGVGRERLRLLAGHRRDLGGAWVRIVPVDVHHRVGGGEPAAAEEAVVHGQETDGAVEQLGAAHPLLGDVHLQVNVLQPVAAQKGVVVEAGRVRVGVVGELLAHTVRVARALDTRAHHAAPALGVDRLLESVVEAQPPEARATADLLLCVVEVLPRGTVGQRGGRPLVPRARD